MEAVVGSNTGSNSHRQEMKYLPAALLVMVMVDGAEGNLRLQRIPSGNLLFAMYNLLSRIFKLACSELSHLLVPLNVNWPVRNPFSPVW